MGQLLLFPQKRFSRGNPFFMGYHFAPAASPGHHYPPEQIMPNKSRNILFKGVPTFKVKKKVLSPCSGNPLLSVFRALLSRHNLQSETSFCRDKTDDW